jgi:hypothetical protein
LIREKPRCGIACFRTAALWLALIDTQLCVHNFVPVRNITLSASEEAIERARQVARNRKTTSNGFFRNWLEQIGEGELREHAYHQQMSRLEGRIRVDRKVTREEMNER